jgi:hydrogenase expression/formation protein HypE
MKTDRILLVHGSGGRLSHDLVEQLFARRFSNPILDRMDDAALLEIFGRRAEDPVAQAIVGANSSIPGLAGKLAFTTDSYVVSPMVFPGGDIGKLAVCGTVNDLAMSGARPLYLSAGFIIEEGLPLVELEQIVESMAATAREAGVSIVTGDTKVVGKGQADRLFINTAGVGIVPSEVNVSGGNAQPGDVVLVNGTVGDHGMAILTRREGLQFTSPLVSDCAPLNGLVESIFTTLKSEGQPCRAGTVHCLRDPTRGGLITALKELALASGVGIELDESSIPVRDAVRAACELLGLDPFYVANEGKLVAVVTPDVARQVLTVLRSHPLGVDAAIIGEVTSAHPRQVVIRTALGARRLADMLTGEQLPRIC